MTSIFHKLTPSAFGSRTTDSRYDGNGEPINLPPPPRPYVARSIVGSVVVNLDAGLQNFRNQEAIVQAELTAKTEQLRQIREAIRALETGLGQLSADPALTDAEREAACGPIDKAMADSVGRALEMEMEMDMPTPEQENEVRVIGADLRGRDRSKTNGVGPHG